MVTSLIPPSTSERKKVLLLSLSGIGNFVMHSVVFEILKKNHPEWDLTVWVVPRGTKTLADANPYVDHVIEGPLQQSIWRHIRFTSRLAKEKFDIGIILSPGQQIKSAIYLFLAGIPVRVGNCYPWLQNQSSSFLLTQAVPEQEDLHDVEQNIHLLSTLLKDLPPHPAHYSLSIPASGHEAAQRVLAALRLPPEAVFYGLHAGSLASMSWKRWPVSSFAEVAKALIEKSGAHILIFGGPDEAELKEQLHTQIGPKSTVINTDLLTAAAVMSHCNIFLSNDSGLMHVAAALGVLTYGLFGPTDERLTGPRGPHSFVIRAPGTQPTYHTEHNPALGNVVDPGMMKITPQMVLEKLL